LSDLPAGWIDTQLGHLLKLKYGRALPDRVRSSTGFPVFGSNGQVGLHEIPLTGGETIVVGRKGSVGEVHFSEGPCSPIDTTYYVDEFSGLPPRYWMYQLRNLYLRDLNKSTAIPGLNREDAYRLPINLPPAAEQKRIADKLDTLLSTVDVCRERLDRVPQILKKFREAVLESAVSGTLTEEWRGRQLTQVPGSTVIQAIADTRRRLGLKSGARTIDDEGIEIPSLPIPDSWAWCRVGEIADVRLGGTPARCENSYWNGTIPWVSSGEVANVRIKDTREYVSKAGVANSNAKLYPVGSVLIAMIGEGKTRGQSAILDISASTNQNVAGLVFDGGEINGEYVWLWALAEYERTRSIGRGGNQPALNGAKIRALPVPVPPRHEQDEIVRRARDLIASLDTLQRRCEDALARVEALTPSVLAKAFRGELVPQDPNDEPAGELLERIQSGCQKGERSGTAGGQRASTGDNPTRFRSARKN
jgi:type I restriction enzyme, S subunit